jgi:hypothetical protein
VHTASAASSKPSAIAKAMPRQPSTSSGEESSGGSGGVSGTAPRAAQGVHTARGGSKPSAIAKAMPRQPSTSSGEKSGGCSSGVSGEAPKGGARRAHGEQLRQQALGHRKGDAEAALDEQRRGELRQRQRRVRRGAATSSACMCGAGLWVGAAARAAMAAWRAASIAAAQTRLVAIL